VHTLRHKSSGFTIVELIVVIAIVAVLAAISIVSYGAWRKNTYSNQVRSELSTVGQSMENARNFLGTYPVTLPNTYTASDGVEVTLVLATETEYCADGISTVDESVQFYLYSEALEQGPLEGTCAERPDLAPPPAPAGIAISASTPSSVALEWDEVSEAASYLAQCAADPAFVQNALQESADHPDVTATIDGFAVDTTLFCRVKAVNDNGGSAWSSIVSGKTGIPPDAPVIAASTDTIPTSRAIFTWPAVSGAVSYTFQYSINGGAWVTGFTEENTLTYSVSGVHSATVDARAVAVSDEGVLSNYGTASIVTPLWGTLVYENGWSDYGSTYETGGFTKTSTGAVVVKGFLKRSGSVVDGETIAVLPSGYRPYTGPDSFLYTFMTGKTGNDSASIKVSSSGEIIASTNASATATGLNGITFMPSTASLGQSFTPLTPLSGWSNRSPLEPSLGYRVDTLGRVFIQGSLDPGTTTSGTDIATLPTSSPDISVSPKLIIGMRAGCNGYTGINIEAVIETRGNCLGSSLYTQTMYYPNAAGASWSAMSLDNGWIPHGVGSNASPEYTKASDGIVTLKGLIKSGSTSAGVILTTLPAGYRPGATTTFASICDEVDCRIDVEANGNVRGRGVSAGWTSLSGINFVAEQ
jgi:prepilin-type N-terminal cleavage/methylation domain-containing protein